MISKQENKSYNIIANTKITISEKINYFLFQKYSKFEFSYSRICINNLLAHERCRIVSRFKDFLFYDDNTEFLHEFCENKFQPNKLKYIFNFYNSYSRIYPNYLILPENKFIYKNIRKKQRIIDEENAIKYTTPKNKKSTNNKNILLENNDYNDVLFFNKSIVDSINRLNKSSIIKSNTKNELNNLITVNGHIINNDIKSFNKISKQNLNKHFKDIKLYNNIGDINEITLNTESSSIIKNNFYEDNTESKASITEILNLINGKNNKINNIKNKNNNKNGSLNKLKNKKFIQKKGNKNHKFKFLMLDIENIKKNIKTYKPKLLKLSNYNVIKAESIKTPKKTIKKEKPDNNKKNKILKNDEKNELESNINKKINNKNIIRHKQVASCLEDISKFLKNNNNKIFKRQQLSILSKLSNNKMKSKGNYNNSLDIKTITTLGKINSKKNNKNDFKSNINDKVKYNIKSKKFNSKTNNLIISTDNITNSNINFGNTYTKINTTNNNSKQNRDSQKTNEINKNNINKTNNCKINKPIETLISFGDLKIKSKIYKEIDLKKVLKFETDSLQSTQVSLNKKTSKKIRPKFSFGDKLLTQIKNTIKHINNINNNITNNITFCSLSKNINTEFLHKDNNFKDKIISYDCKPFPGYSQKNNYYTKIQLKKQRTSSLIKNNKIFNFFTSKDFYNLKIENNNNINNMMKSSQNRSITKHLEKIFLNRKKNKSTNKNYENSKDLNIIDSHSFLLKTFNKEKNHKNSDNSYNKKINKYKYNLNYFNVNKFKKNYLKNFCTSKNISNDKSDIMGNYIIFHKKNKTTNFCKIIEEIEKMKNEMNLRNDKRYKINCINSLNKNNKNINNYKIKYTTPSKSLIKSVEIKNSKNNGNTNFKKNENDIFIKDKFRMNT